MFKISSDGWSWCLGFAITINTIAVPTNAILAQINPDSTLPGNSSVTLDENTSIITGGTQAGSNLFHSFKDFSVSTGGTAFFNNAQDIQNIFSRVTGGSVSNIDGLIRANGTANLFLINPNGIIFGPNASLNIGGSFLASTANSLKFADGYQFSATAPQTTIPLLTISVPIGLQYGLNPNSSIRVNGNGHNLGFSVGSYYVDRTNRPLGLHYGTQTGKTIALVGANVVLDGGNISLPEGRVEIWSVKNGEVSLTNKNQQVQLEPGQGINYGNIELLNAASIDTSGNSAGSIQLRGKNISLTNGSVIFTDTIGNGTPGTLNVLASESVKVQGIVDNPNSQFYSGIFADVAPDATGNGSNITIDTQSLLLIDGGQIQSATYGIGSAGDLDVKAKDIQLIGDSLLGASGLFSPVTPGATGNGGNVSIETESLRVLAGAQITTTTFGAGNAGELTIKANDIEVKGVAEYTDIFTGESLEDPSILAATVEKIPGFANSGTGRGGNVKIQTQNLRLVEGGQIASATSGLGDAGNLQLNANNVELVGVSKTARSGLFASAIQESGNGGNITVNANQLTIRDGATISVSNFQSQNKVPPGTGAAGSIQINAPSLLMKQGTISADTNAGDFGNITIQSQNTLMSRGSRISTNAFNSSRGGNLTISTETIVAVENSDITANAFSGRGGNVLINSQGVFGISSRPRQTEKSDITASSESGVAGAINLIAPDNSALQNSLSELSQNPIDTNALIANSCIGRTRSKEGTFTITGSGGLPHSPGNPSVSLYSTGDVRQVISNTSTSWKKGEPIVEATGVYRLADGRLVMSRECL